MSKVKFDPSRAIDNINSIIKEKNLKQEAISAITGAKQSNVSTILNKKKTATGSYKFFTVEQLAALSIEWDISLNELLGISSNNTHKPQPTPRSICKFIASLKSCNLFMTTTERSEHCYYETIDPSTGMPDIDHIYKVNRYPSIYFSNWMPIVDEEDALTASQIGNHNPHCEKINTFLIRLKKIHKMKTDGDIDEEMYDILLNKYLDDVPDK